MNDDPNATELAASKESTWMRIVYAIVLLVLYALAETALWVLTVLQILFKALNGQVNARIAEFGTNLSDWTRHTVRYLTGASDARPFPWDEARD